VVGLLLTAGVAALSLLAGLGLAQESGSQASIIPRTKAGEPAGGPAKGAGGGGQQVQRRAADRAVGNDVERAAQKAQAAAGGPAWL